MTDPITIHGFETSNNMKVRVALGYKGLPYTFEPVDPGDRSRLVALSGQQLTPVMQHGAVVLFDSAAILRYLDVAFPDTPRLFGTTRDEQWAIEDWELFARAVLARPMMDLVHTRVQGGDVDPGMERRTTTAFHDAMRQLIEGLGTREWLVGTHMTAADVTTAAVVHRIRSAELLAMPAAADSLGPWVERVMRYDAHRA